MADTGKTIGLIKALASVDPEAIKSSVDDWLDDHPEATTTVEDGAITKAKLDSSLQQTVDDVGDLKSAISEITTSSRNMFDNAALLSAGLSVDENGYYYGTVKTWRTAFSSLLPVVGEFEAGKRYTVSLDYYFGDVETYTGNALSIKSYYTDETSGNLINLSASKTTPFSVSATTSATKNLDYLAFTLQDARTDNYILYVKDLQIEEGATKTEYIPHTVAYDANAEKSIQAVKGEITEINAHIDNVTKNNSSFAWELGGMSSTGAFVTATSRIRVKSSTKMQSGAKLSCDSGYKFRLYRYSGHVDPSMDSTIVASKYIDTSEWQTEPYTLTNDGYYEIAFATTSDTASVGIESHLLVQENIAVNEVWNALPQYAKLTDIAGFADKTQITAAVECLANNTTGMKWEVGFYNSSTGQKQAVNTTARTSDLVHLSKGTRVFVDADYMYRIYRYSDNLLSSFVEYYGYSYDSTLHYITGYFDIPNDGYYNFVVTDYAMSTVTDADAMGAHLHVEPSIALNDLKSAVSLGIMPYNLIGLKSYIETIAGMGGDVVLSFVTDIHGGYPDTYDVINYLANSGIGNYMFEMGDVIKSTYPTRAEAVAYLRESFHTMAYTQTNTPVIFLQGNHDTDPLSGTDTSKNVTQEIFYGLSMARAKNVCQPVKKAYGYVDIDAAKVRVIYLNTSDIYDATTGAALVTGQYTMIQQGQLDWFSGTALNLSDKDTPTDWSIIIVSHDSLSQVAGSAFAAILTAFMSGATASGTQTVTVGTYSNVLTYNCDFTAQGGIDVICEVNGHHHKDMIRELGSTGIQQVYVACEGPASASYDDNGTTVYYTRNRGTTDEHLIDTLVLDKANRKVYFKRFGVGEDREISY